jgi:hypothetical protein
MSEISLSMTPAHIGSKKSAVKTVGGHAVMHREEVEARLVVYLPPEPRV